MAVDSTMVDGLSIEWTVQSVVAADITSAGGILFYSLTFCHFSTDASFC